MGMYLDGKNKLAAAAAAAAPSASSVAAAASASALSVSSAASPSILTTLAAANSTSAITWATLLGNTLAILLPLLTPRVASCLSTARRACGWPNGAGVGEHTASGGTGSSGDTASARAAAGGGNTADGETAGSPGAALTLSSLFACWVEGIQEVAEALIILFLAWALGDVVHDLHSAEFLSGALGSWLPATLLPLISMLLAMLVSFGIGSAWGTMGVLVPLVAPLAWDLSHRDIDVLTASLGAVLGGSLFGNVSSPLADTSVLTSMVCKCDMLEHVSSQASYTLLTACLALLLGALPVGLGAYPVGVALGLGAIVLALAPVLAKAMRRACRRLPAMGALPLRRGHYPSSIVGNERGGCGGAAAAATVASGGGGGSVQ